MEVNRGASAGGLGLWLLANLGPLGYYMDMAEGMEIGELEASKGALIGTEVKECATKVALVAIVGRPSVGKSTFLNAVTGQDVAIVSPYPQTTRDSIRGIVNTKAGQLVFIDTPGLHGSTKKLNLRLRAIALRALRDADLILYMLDATRPMGEEEAMILGILRGYAARVLVAVNKIDLAQGQYMAVADSLKDRLGEDIASRVYGISCKSGEGIKELIASLYAHSPTGELLYPSDYYTDQDVNFRISEIIRGAAIQRLSQELPHALYVDIADIEFRSPKLLWVRAFLCVERESQKAIAIGKGAIMIRAIRIQSMRQCRKVFPYKVAIDLSVRVDKNWRSNDNTLKRLVK